MFYYFNVIFLKMINLVFLVNLVNVCVFMCNVCICGLYSVINMYCLFIFYCVYMFNSILNYGYDFIIWLFSISILL